MYMLTKNKRFVLAYVKIVTFLRWQKALKSTDAKIAEEEFCVSTQTQSKRELLETENYSNIYKETD